MLCIIGCDIFCCFYIDALLFSEYCLSRAVPSIQLSGYLSTLGTKLMPGIDIMWTGCCCCCCCCRCYYVICFYGVQGCHYFAKFFVYLCCFFDTLVLDLFLCPAIVFSNHRTYLCIFHSICIADRMKNNMYCKVFWVWELQMSFHGVSFLSY